MAGTKRKRFQLSSLPPEERERLAGYIKQLGGTLLDTRIFSRQTTHVICGKANRGEKYLGGCALGKWVLQKEFVEDSFKQGSWLNEEQYEWTSSVLPVRADKQLSSLHDAPRKWRMALQNTKAGAYKSWNAVVYMQDAKMKKAYERLLEAGNATVYKKNVSFQDPCGLPKDLTHIFVETKLKHEVLHLQSQGISICEPDHIPEYIIAGPKETFASSNTLMKYNNLVNTHTPKIPAKTKEKPGVQTGKENGSAVELTSKEGVLKKGVKRSTSDCDLCVVKRQKTAVNGLPPFVHITSTENPPTARNLTFPVYVSSILESCIDEECVDLGMESVASCLSSYQAPTSKWLHIIIEQFLLNAPTQHQALQSYRLLQNIIEVHPPTVRQKLYLEALVEPAVENSQNLNSNKPTPWQFISKVIRNSFGENNTTGETKRMQSNADLVLTVLDNLFKRDAHGGGKQSSIIVSILWPASPDSACQSNLEMKQFVAQCFEATRLAVSDESKLFVCHVLLDWLSMAVTLRRRDDVTGHQACDSLAQQLFMQISKTDCYEATKLFLQGSHSSWLKMKILEFILDNYDKRLIPAPYKQHLNKILKLNKIVNCYFFLLPNVKNSGKTEVEKRTVTRRKNRKGESSLHVACIRNDPAKVEEILKLETVDVNETDNAGWTALHEACNRGHLRCVKKILRYHEKTNKVNLLACPAHGVTVLHDAVLNNHLPVVKLLTQAGGLNLLQAKTKRGMTALQLARSDEILSCITSELNTLQSQRACDQIHGDTLRPLPDAYGQVLSKNKRKNYISLAECEKYLFYISQLVEVYLRENNVMESTCMMKNGVKFCPKCKDDANVVKNYSQHLENLEDHVKTLSGKRSLSPLCQLYMSSMRLCC
ncbi:uncharacterized protein LOC114520372 [Dendronephthya gigantea]|uniref:uncharacterized protein LOC114520372 n=1 Tax=Dendronephthya gigantea TaxID=151771 RepID=UPI00106B951D|nr:uncharacterized protein LOC114520372 [Dendronephthya gigantea]